MLCVVASPRTNIIFTFRHKHQISWSDWSRSSSITFLFVRVISAPVTRDVTWTRYLSQNKRLKIIKQGFVLFHFQTVCLLQHFSHLHFDSLSKHNVETFFSSTFDSDSSNCPDWPTRFFQPHEHLEVSSLIRLHRTRNQQVV